MFLPDHFLKWALASILAANIAEAEKEIYASEVDEEELEAEDSEESCPEDAQSELGEK